MHAVDSWSSARPHMPRQLLVHASCASHAAGCAMARAAVGDAPAAMALWQRTMQRAASLSYSWGSHVGRRKPGPATRGLVHTCSICPSATQSCPKLPPRPPQHCVRLPQAPQRIAELPQLERIWGSSLGQQLGWASHTGAGAAPPWLGHASALAYPPYFPSDCEAVFWHAIGSLSS